MVTPLKNLPRVGTDLRQIAALLRSKGRYGDTVLAHINPKEAALLKARGGAGTANPETGLPEFYDYGGDYDMSGVDYSQYGAQPEDMTPQAAEMPDFSPAETFSPPQEISGFPVDTSVSEPFQFQMPAVGQETPTAPAPTYGTFETESRGFI